MSCKRMRNDRKRSHTLTYLSQPALTMTGFAGLGLKRTHETHSVWPWSVIVYLQSLSVFQSLIVRSREPETICRLSAEKETERTSLVWPTNRRVVWPVESSHRRRVLSQDEERAYAPSEEITWQDYQTLVIFNVSEQTYAVRDNVFVAVQRSLRVSV